MKKIYYGIDFGNTNTTVVQILADPSGKRVVPLGEEGAPFPSILAIHRKSGEVLYGREVKYSRQRLAEDHAIITSFKSRLGTDYIETVAGHHYNAVELTALLLKSVKDYIKTHNKLELTEAVFSIPVDFTGKKRRDLRLAAKLAGITVTSFVSEPTAAYIGCLETLGGYSRLAVFDWGGGTLDVSILDREGSKLRELSVRGLNLGGDDLDLILAKKIHGRLASEYMLDTFDTMSARDRDRMLERCETSKIELSDEDFTRFGLLNYGSIRQKTIAIELTEFTELITPQIKQAAQTLEKALQEANSYAQLDAVLMVGGSSNIRAIRHVLTESFERKEIKVIHPEQAQWAAARGAAEIAATNSGYRLQQNIGVLLADQTIFPILAKDTVIPFHGNEVRFGVVEETTSAHIIIANENGKRLGTEALPIKGFTSEGIQIKASVNEDLVAAVQMQSTHRPDDVRTLELPSIEFCYDLDIKPKQPNTVLPQAKTHSVCSYHGCSEPIYKNRYCRYHYNYEKAASK